MSKKIKVRCPACKSTEFDVTDCDGSSSDGWMEEYCYCMVCSTTFIIHSTIVVDRLEIVPDEKLDDSEEEET